MPSYSGQLSYLHGRYGPLRPDPCARKRPAHRAASARCGDRETCAHQQRLVLLGEFLQRGAADFIRHVTNTLQLGDSFDDRHYQTQVARGWLTLGNDAHARFVDGDFHHIDVVIAFDNALRQLAVWLCIAVIASESCCSTMPPMVITGCECFPALR